MQFKSRLERAMGAALAARLAADAEAWDRLEALDRLVVHWGGAVGLVGFRERAEREHRYFAEALAAAPWLPEKGTAVDIGSGGGSPALPLAILRASLKWSLVESNERKALFLDEAVRTLRLENVRVARCAYESFAPDVAVEVMTVRGVGLDHETLRKIHSELAPSGRLLWFSSERKLSEARQRHAASWETLEKPVRLVAGGGYLWVASPRPS